MPLKGSQREARFRDDFEKQGKPNQVTVGQRCKSVKHLCSSPKMGKVQKWGEGGGLYRWGFIEALGKEAHFLSGLAKQKSDLCIYHQMVCPKESLKSERELRE